MRWNKRRKPPCGRASSAANGPFLESGGVLLYAYINAFYQTGYTNPIDEAIRNHRQLDVSRYEKLDEVLYDFVRKRLRILVSKDGRGLMVTKGALQNVLAVCSLAEMCDGAIVDMAAVGKQVQQRFEEFSSKGFRTLGVAYRHVDSARRITKDDETGMTFLGFLMLFDPPKLGLSDTIGNLRRLGVSLKVITGDNRLVAASVSEEVGAVQSADSHRVRSSPDERGSAAQAGQ